MKAIDVIRQLQASLPRNTNAFSDVLDVLSLTSSGTTATCVTNVSHGLSTGDYVNIQRAYTPNIITSLTQVNNIATAITTDWHDLTENYQESVLIVGTNEIDYNGEKKLLKVPNRKTFTYQIENNPSSPATGTPTLMYEYIGVGYNGLHQIIVINTTAFTYQLERSFGSPAYGIIKANCRLRISGAASIDRAIDSYTKQTNGSLWAFVVLDDISANKDRQQYNDSTQMVGSGISYRQLIIQPFDVYVFFPATISISGREQFDAAQDLLIAIMSSLARVKFPYGFEEVPYSGCVFKSSNYYEYNTAYYIHKYTFETNAWINYQDTSLPSYNVAFRDIFLDFKNYFEENGKTIAQANVDLDDEPLT